MVSMRSRRYKSNRRFKDRERNCLSTTVMMFGYMADNWKPGATGLSRHDELDHPVKAKQGWLLLLSLVSLILIYPLLDHERLSSALILGSLTFFPLIVAAVKLSRKRVLFWVFIALFVGGGVSMIGGVLLASPVFLAIHWAVLTLLFILAISGLFRYVRFAAEITADHLFTAASIYLLLASMWFTLYEIIETIQPSSFQQTITGASHSQPDLLYFSLATLTTLGYGDIVPVGGEVRMLAALEAVVGVLYVAITVALLVGAYRRTEQ